MKISPMSGGRRRKMKVVFGKDEKGALVAQAGEVMTKNVKKLGEVEVQGGVTPTILQQLLSAFEAGWEKDNLVAALGRLQQPPTKRG